MYYNFKNISLLCLILSSSAFFTSKMAFCLLSNARLLVSFLFKYSEKCLCFKLQIIAKTLAITYTKLAQFNNSKLVHEITIEILNSKTEINCDV